MWIVVVILSVLVTVLWFSNHFLDKEVVKLRSDLQGTRTQLMNLEHQVRSLSDHVVTQAELESHIRDYH